jgi:hypothetical protein
VVSFLVSTVNDSRSLLANTLDAVTSLDRFLELANTFNNSSAAESVGDEALAAEDQAILDAYAEEVRSRPPSGAITVRPGVAEDSGANRDG